MENLIELFEISTRAPNLDDTIARPKKKRTLTPDPYKEKKNPLEYRCFPKNPHPVW